MKASELAALNEQLERHFGSISVKNTEGVAVIGTPNGKPAYAYMRVSSDEQASEFGTGLLRQLDHIHAAAARDGYFVTFSSVYHDEYSGFADFDERPILTTLRNEYKKRDTRRADAVIIEDLDRLSRDSDWHQGFLLAEMSKNGVTTIFWEKMNSRIERSVNGAISMDGMEKTKQRLRDGRDLKARQGHVTAQKAAYGYKFVNSAGQDRTQSDSWRKDKYYAPNEQESWVVKLIFEKLASGVQRYQIAKELDQLGIKPPTKTGPWDDIYITMIVQNPVYKGDFIHNRYKTSWSGKKMTKRELRPESEQIIVPVPAIVSRELWATANEQMRRSWEIERHRNRRKHEYLAVGLIRCVSCGRLIVTAAVPYKEKMNLYYHCNRYDRRDKKVTCHQRGIHCQIVDNIVWNVIVKSFTDPQTFGEEFDRHFAERGNDNQKHLDRIAHLRGLIVNCQDEIDKQERAYIANIHTLEEYAERRRLLKDRQESLGRELALERSLLVTEDEMFTRKQEVLARIAQIRTLNGNLADLSFDFRRRLVKLLVTEIRLDVTNKIIEIDGAIRGVYKLSVDMSESITVNAI